MENLIFFLKKTIGKKIAVGVTGLGLCLFVLIHMSGNLLILKGAESYNLYAKSLHDFFLMEFLEWGLLAFFLGHIFLSVLLNLKNLKSKGAYFKRAKGEKKTSFANRILILQGLVLFVFLVFHLITFKFGAYYEAMYDGEATRDVYLLVTETFKKFPYVLGYVFSLLVLGVHLVHGLSASIRSLGFYHPLYTPWIEKLSFAFGCLVTLGFMGLPLYIYFIL